MDTDGSGNISREEVKGWVDPRLAKLANRRSAEFGALTVDGLADELMAWVDQNGDGALTMEEVQESIHENATFEASPLHAVLHAEMR